MKTIVLASRKGGAGKTTNARHLAVAFSQAGKKVLLVDTDLQGTLTKWHKRRKTDDLPLLQVAYEDLAKSLPMAAKAGYEVVIIDTPPDSNEAIESTVKLADFVLIPGKASPDDIEAIPSTKNLVSSLGIPFAFVINEAKTGTTLLTMAMETLSQLGPLAPTQYAREAIKARAVVGETVLDTPVMAKQAEDAKRLYNYVHEQLEALGA